MADIVAAPISMSQQIVVAPISIAQQIEAPVALYAAPSSVTLSISGQYLVVKDEGVQKGRLRLTQ